MTTRLVELSHVIEHGMVTYRGLPGPVIGDHLSREASEAHYAPGTTFHIGRIEMITNTGTYLDTPAHRYADGADLSQLPLAALAALPGVLVAPDEIAIGADAFEGLDAGGAAVLVRTGWDRHWRTEAYGPGGHPHLTAEAADRLASAGAALVGIDSVNLDDTSTGERPAHSLLLAAGIPVVEHLCNLDHLPPSAFDFFAVPPMIRGLGTFPVRAFAVCR